MLIVVKPFDMAMDIVGCYYGDDDTNDEHKEKITGMNLNLTCCLGCFRMNIEPCYINI